VVPLPAAAQQVADPSNKSTLKLEIEVPGPGRHWLLYGIKTIMSVGEEASNE